MVRIEGQATIGGNTYDSGRTYSDFEETDRVMYPTRMTHCYTGDPADGTIGRLEINPGFPPTTSLFPQTSNESLPRVGRPRPTEELRGPRE